MPDTSKLKKEFIVTRKGVRANRTGQNVNTKW